MGYNVGYKMSEGLHPRSMPSTVTTTAATAGDHITMASPVISQSTVPWVLFLAEFLGGCLSSPVGVRDGGFLPSNTAPVWSDVRGGGRRLAHPSTTSASAGEGGGGRGGEPAHPSSSHHGRKGVMPLSERPEATHAREVIHMLRMVLMTLVVVSVVLLLVLLLVVLLVEIVVEIVHLREERIE
jgi:hypothetical protein